MSDENLWGEEDSFLDMPDEAKLDENGKPKKAPPVVNTRQHVPPTAPQAPAPEQYEELAIEDEAPAEEMDAEAEEVLADANLRIEQGTLYKMIMNHNLFEGVDADPRAVQNVQRQIRQFAKEQMEIMLGMRREAAAVERLEIDFPFNAMEVEVLKQLALTATKGASEYSDKYVPDVSRVTEEVESVPRRSINPIGAPKRAVQPKRPLAKKPVAPLKRTRLDKTIDQIAAEEGIPRELLEENLPGIGGKKAIREMTETELLERNSIAAKRRGTQVPSSNSIPMPTPEQQELMVAQRANQMSNGLMSQIIDAAKKMPPTKMLINPEE